MPAVILRLAQSTLWLLPPLLLVLLGCAGSWAEPRPAPAPDPTTRTWFRLLFDPVRGVNALVLQEITTAKRQDFVPVLVELLRFQPQGASALATTLHTLTGQTFGSNWEQWMEWLGAQSLPPPPGFAEWKGELFGLLDERFHDFLYDTMPTRIKLEEIVWGGVFKDGIPALVNPPFLPAAEATYLTDDELVFGLVVHGDVRAYPHRILDWHEMANDVVGEVPIALTY
ncbi:MAG: DUF3179 domain-containing protein [Candidatus Tectomicrobia bacterium]|uniref:DUF3179 domain-containing protein n=1 Tax=Tectimicrobiota bacterium TaxID=2528274 RepID=A0A937VZS6_UNCTE|nr:DUF3179 domain-containing protein [Candidatus Tectomicrobia bacterium]